MGKEALLYMYDRVKLAQSVTEVMIITSTNPNDDKIEALCRQHNIPCFRGDENDLLDRHYQAAKHEQADFVLKIPSDSPLTDYRLIDKMVNYWIDHQSDIDFVTNISPGTFPDGLDVEGCSFPALEKAWKEAKKVINGNIPFPTFGRIRRFSG